MITKKRVLIAIVVILVGIQFIRIDQTNPPVDPTKDFIAVTQPHEKVAGLLKNACYDCHSNETVYPWYTNIAPVSFWMRNHILGARKQVNFSEWGDYSERDASHAMEECYEMVDEGEMPLNSYVRMHPEAELTEQERQILMGWFKQVGRF